ncbi:two-component sensor histidine kinase [Clostridium butyricum]|uniref:histidine kinase n=1 Tax=Clostridium butyricum TaxID=1492 RepID=A0A512TSQ2_CLOBU|nr:HAMP domain-containing sensor histidine kinase [Clostridium butyricum]NOW21511.1 hypothetical protein [Clostridium butyricum]GEQ23310.1 two-component sensor histidine kinase [Clostridium butyricum]
MERIVKEKSISKVFVKYIICFCITNILFIGIIIFLYGVLFNTHIMYPANYFEQKIESNRDKISKEESIDELIPDRCFYSLYDFNGNVLSGNMTNEKAKDVWQVVENNKINVGNYYYKVIPRKEDICIVAYEIKPSFVNPILNKYIPDPEMFIYIAVLIIFVVEILIFANMFKKRIQKEQTGAMAHDIKTPLTIIKGNAELINEGKLSDEEYKFTQNILTEVENMEGYIKTLIEIMTCDKEVKLKKKTINFHKFICEVINQAESMCVNKKISFETRRGHIPEAIEADKYALKRAIGNVISNAVEYTPIDGKIIFSVCEDSEKIVITIENSGREFTKEELTSASQKFYRGDKSRNSKSHYGMGLYISRKMIEKHGGVMVLENSDILGGAKIIFYLHKR